MTYYSKPSKETERLYSEPSKITVIWAIATIGLIGLGLRGCSPKKTEMLSGNYKVTEMQWVKGRRADWNNNSLEEKRQIDVEFVDKYRCVNRKLFSTFKLDGPAQGGDGLPRLVMKFDKDKSDTTLSRDSLRYDAPPNQQFSVTYWTLHLPEEKT